MSDLWDFVEDSDFHYRSKDNFIMYKMEENFFYKTLEEFVTFSLVCYFIFVEMDRPENMYLKRNGKMEYLMKKTGMLYGFVEKVLNNLFCSIFFKYY
jgi:hypothetical protein